METEDLTFQILQEITDDFCEERKLGEGAYGVVYKGVTKNGDEVAVKKLRVRDNLELDENQFRNEFYNLTMLQHKNIVQFLGYCYETKKSPMEFNGRIVHAEERYRALCFEYMHNGSLEKHLSDEFRGFDWHTRFKIIKGTWKGLGYLHEGSEKPIYHLDLKPDNILLDKDMVPKIADFGLSMIIGKELMRSTKGHLGTLGYQPPEHIEEGEISNKFDIFSLGVVMLKIISGPEGYSKCAYMTNDAFIDLVKNNWKNRLQAVCSGSSLDTYCHQVEICTQIAMNCVEKDKNKRPNIVNVIHKLNESETNIGKLHWRSCSFSLGGYSKHNKELQDENQNSKLVTTASCNDLVFVDTRETSSVIRGDLIVGRTKEKSKIISLLESKKEKITILAIYGIGGIGKTTFAKIIYNYFKEYSRAWVYVSPNFELNKIGNSIISQLSAGERQINERQEMHSCLTNLFSGKKIMIVLDDLWEENAIQLEDLTSMLSVGDSVSTIVLVTTRSKGIAKTISTNHLPYKIEELTDDLCWKIIKQRSDFEARYDKDQLSSTGKEIARKCRGVALAAQSLGFMLHSMTSDQWMEVKENDIWSESTSEDASPTNHVLASLKLSYDSMPPNLKLCFAYCAIFPKGYKIVKDDLTYQWISLGFIKPTKLLSIMQLCEKYIMQLQGMSFLHHSVIADGAYERGFTLFTMHDLVYDLARLVMADEILDASTKHAITGERIYRYALLTSTIQLDSYRSYPDKIRALCFMGSGQFEVHDEEFLSRKSLQLQVLDLSECCKHELPTSVSKLAELRYLNAQKIQSKRIPDCVTRLSKLIYLNLSGCGMSALPGSIGEIKGLMYLDISYCSHIRHLPESFANLKKLIHLNLSNCALLDGVHALASLTNLQYLNLSLPAKTRVTILALELQQIIGNLIELRYLNLSYYLKYMFLAPEGTSSLSKKMLSFFDSICSLSNLEHLDLSHNSCLVSLPESIANFRKLHTLDVSFCIKLVSLPKCVVRMNGLKIINVAGCSSLDRSTLSQSKIAALLSHFTVHSHRGESTSNISLLRQSNPEELHISSLHNVMSTEEVHNIELMEKWRIKDLKIEWSRDAQRSVEDVEVLGELVPPRTLRKFNINCYNSVGFPAWVMDIRTYLPYLIKIVLCDLYKCKSLPPLGQLSNLQELVMEGMDSIAIIEEGFCGNTRAFPQLTKFRLCRMENLKVWNTMYSFGKDGMKEFMFPNLHELSICNCPKLKLKQCPPRAQRWEIESSDNILSSCGGRGETCPSTNALTGHHKLRTRSCLPITEYWNLWNSDNNVISSRRGGEQTCASSSASRTYMVVKSTTLPLHEWMLLYHLPALTELRIIHCEDLSCDSEKFIRYISSIESMWLEDNNQPELPKWLGDLMNLRELIIRRCTSLSNLQVAIQHLPLLQLLCLKGCPSIRGLPEPKPGSLASLKELVIWDCRGIKSLPKGILAKLKLLYIYHCTELAVWCELDEFKPMLRSITNKIMLPNERVCIPVVSNLVHQ